jgi:hypothetical protein
MFEVRKMSKYAIDLTRFLSKLPSGMKMTGGSNMLLHRLMRLNFLAFSLSIVAVMGCRSISGSNLKSSQASESDANLLICSGTGSDGLSYSMSVDRAGFDRQSGIPVEASLRAATETAQKLSGRASISESSFDANFGLERLHLRSQDEGKTYRGKLSVGEKTVDLNCQVASSQSSAGDDQLLICTGKGSDGLSYALTLYRAGFDQQPGIPVEASLRAHTETAKKLKGRASIKETSIDANFGLERLHLRSQDEGKTYRGTLSVSEKIINLDCRTTNELGPVGVQ